MESDIKYMSFRLSISGWSGLNIDYVPYTDQPWTITLDKDGDVYQVSGSTLAEVFEAALKIKIEAFEAELKIKNVEEKLVEELKLCGDITEVSQK